MRTNKILYIHSRFYFSVDMQYVLFNWNRLNIWNDTKKCFRLKLYGIEGDILYFYLFDLARILKSPVKLTLKFLDRCLNFLLHILAADIQTFLK